MILVQKTEGVSKGHLLFFFNRCSFLFVRPKRNEPKKKGAGNDNFSLFWQNALGVTLPKRLKFAPFPVCHRTTTIEITVNNCC